MGVGVGRIHDLDAALAARRDVDVVEPGPGPSHDLKSGGGTQERLVDDRVGAHDEARRLRHHRFETRIISRTGHELHPIGEPRRRLGGQMFHLDDGAGVAHTCLMLAFFFGTSSAAARWRR